MTLLLTIIHYVVCLVLIVVILLQAGKGQGLAGGGFGNETANSLFGTKTGDMLTKLTTISAIAFIVTSLSLDVLNSKKQQSLMSDLKELQLPQEIVDLAKEKNIDVNELKKQLADVSKDSDSEVQKVTTEVKTVVPEVKEVASAVKEQTANTTK